MTRAQSFGAVAAAYERFRPGYPDALVDAVLSYAGALVRSALEIGAGTGKATRAFAARGIVVTASEPDAAMLAELSQHVPRTVSAVRAAFEDLPLTGSFDLVYAAAAMHWTDPHDRWDRVAAMLTGDGVFASFGGPVSLADPELEDAVHAARAPIVPDDDVPVLDDTPEDSPLRWPGTELLESERFTDVRQVEIPRRLVWSAGHYLGHLATISAYLQLSAADLAEVLDRIDAVLPREVTVTADLTLHLARAVGPTGDVVQRHT